MWFKIMALEERIVLDAAVGDAVQPDAEPVADAPDGDLADPATLQSDPLLAQAVPPLDPGDDLFTTTEGVSVTFSVNDLLANDPPRSLFQSIGSPSFGTIAPSPLPGEYIYTPDLGFTGVDSTTYEVFNSSRLIETYEIFFDVQPLNANTPPNAQDDMASTSQDLPVSIDILANDSDLDGDPLNITFVSNASHGLVSLDPFSNLVIYTPDLGFVGTDSFTYEITDGTDNDTATVTIEVLGVNSPPIAVNDSFMFTQGEEILISSADMLANDSDPDNDPLTIQTPNRPTTTASGNTVDLTPEGFLVTLSDPLFVGLDSFDYTISDGMETSTATVSLEILPANNPPIAQDDMATTAPDMPVDINILANDSDPDGDPLSISLLPAMTVNGGRLTADPLDPTFVTYIPAPGFVGLDSFDYTISDGQGGTDTATVTINVALSNQPPTAADDNVQTDEDMPITIDVLANDNDLDGDTLNITFIGLPANGQAVLNPDNTITYTPNANFNGPDSFQYTIDDGQGGIASANVNIDVQPVNDAPDAQDDVLVIDENTSGMVDLLANDSDVEDGQYASSDPDPNPDPEPPSEPKPDPEPQPDPDPEPQPEDPEPPSEPKPDPEPQPDPGGNLPIIEIIEGPQNGTATLQGGILTYTPNANFNGQDSVRYRITDSGGLSDEAIVAITINSVNDAPDAQDDMVMTDEDVPLIIHVADLLANDSDIDGDALSLAGIGQPAHGQLADNGDGTLTYTPNANFNGPDSFQYTIDDGNGGMDTANVNIDVKPVNDAPVAQDDMAMTDEDVPLIINVADLLANDSDIDGDALSLAGIGQPANGQLVDNGDGTLTYTPNANFNGPDNFQYSIDDGNGGMASATVNIDVKPVNDAPMAADDQLTVGAGLAGMGNVLDNDTDADLPNDQLRVELVQGPAHGELILNADGSFEYEHDGSRNFADSFAYRVIDADGASDEAEVNIAVEEQSNGPKLKLLGFNKRLYIENQGAKRLSPAVFIYDRDSKDFDGGKLRVELSENGTMNDMLLIKENRKLQVDEMGQVFYRGEHIGQLEGGQNGEALIVTFNENANAWDVARVISRVAYQNDSDNPSTAMREVTFSVTDGDGGISNAAERNIRFLDVNDDPEILSENKSANVDPGDILNLGEDLGLQIADADLDEDGMIQVTLKVKHGNLNFTETEDLETVIFSNELDEDGSRKIKFMASLEESNLLLSRLTYEANDGYTGTDYLWMKVSDLGGDGLLGGVGKDWACFRINVC